MDEIKLILENLTEEEREQLMELVKKANQKKEKVWKPVNMDSNYDESCYTMGNCYKTEEDVEFSVEKRKVEVELQRFADEYNEDEFDVFEEDRRYVINYIIQNNNLKINYYRNIIFGTTVFSSREIAEQAIKTIGEDRIKKYIFGVK